MIGTTFKTILFAGMITVIITAALLPFGTDAQAEIKYDPSDIKTAFEIADPFIIQDEHYILQFDVNAAQEKMSEFQIQIITDFVSLQNDYVNKVHDNPNEKPTFDEKLDEKFSKLKEHVKESKSSNKSEAYNWILPPAFAWSDICGGSLDNPHPEYKKKTIWTAYSQSTAVSIVESLGYHRVLFYASNPSEWFNPNSIDYGKKINAYNCNFGAFRDQIVLDNDGEWDLNKQIKEPNPEFLDYVSPVWWWTYYTAIWHQSGIGGEEAW